MYRERIWVLVEGGERLAICRWPREEETYSVVDAPRLINYYAKNSVKCVWLLTRGASGVNHSFSQALVHILLIVNSSRGPHICSAGFGGLKSISSLHKGVLASRLILGTNLNVSLKRDFETEILIGRVQTFKLRSWPLD